RRGTIAGVEDRGVDRVPVGRGSERSWGVAEERDDRKRAPAEGASDVRRVEHPDVGATDAFGGELWVDGAVLTPVRGGDERAVSPWPREDDVPRLVSHEQRSDDVRGRRGDVDDAHAVGEVVHDPHLAVRPGRHRHRLEPDGYRTDVAQPTRPDV